MCSRKGINLAVYIMSFRRPAIDVNVESSASTPRGEASSNAASSIINTNSAAEGEWELNTFIFSDHIDDDDRYWKRFFLLLHRFSYFEFYFYLNSPDPSFWIERKIETEKKMLIPLELSRLFFSQKNKNVDSFPFLSGVPFSAGLRRSSRQPHPNVQIKGGPLLPPTPLGKLLSFPHFSTFIFIFFFFSPL